MVGEQELLFSLGGKCLDRGTAMTTRVTSGWWDWQSLSSPFMLIPVPGLI